MVFGKVLSLNVSSEKGVPKHKVKRAFLKAHWGIVNDAHAGTKGREISLLPVEAIRKFLPEQVKRWTPGEYSENITISGIPLEKLQVGNILRVGDSVVEIIHIGKDVFHDEGRPFVVSREGRFGDVLKDGWVRVGDKVSVINPVRIGILVASDKGFHGKRVDKSGPAIEEIAKLMGGRKVFYKVVPDDEEVIYSTMKEWVDSGKVDLIFTSGGTGFSQRDVTPDATRRLIDKEILGFPEIMRVVGYTVSPRAILSRAIAGISGKVMIVNLPGSVKAVRESMELIVEPLAHGMDILLGRETDHA